MQRRCCVVLTVVLLALAAVGCAPATTPAAPVGASPVAKPAATAPAAPAAAGSDQQAVASFYRGKTIRLVVGYAAGGPFDLHARMVARYLPQYMPGNPSAIVENRPGAGGFVATNLVYASEPKDGTVINLVGAGLPLQQALGKEGIQFDVTKMNWLGSGTRTVSACTARVDTGITSIQELIGPNAKQLVVGAIGPGTTTFDTPSVLNAALGTNFKIVSGYDGSSKILLAIEAKEADGMCGNLDAFTSAGHHLVEGPEPVLRLLIAMGAEPVDQPLLNGVPVAELLAPTEEARQMLQAVNSQSVTYHPYAVAPGVPADRVEALRRALTATFEHAQFRAEAQQAGFDTVVVSGEDLGRAYQRLLGLPPATLAKLKDVLK